MKVYLIWLICVVSWNFGFPDAVPIADVLVAVLLSFRTYQLSAIINKKGNA